MAIVIIYRSLPYIKLRHTGIQIVKGCQEIGKTGVSTLIKGKK